MFPRPFPRYLRPCAWSCNALSQCAARPSSAFAASSPLPHQPPPVLRRSFRILAIETSCDDTCVAVLELKARRGAKYRTAKLLFNQRITSNNLRYGGVHPLRSLESHQENLALLLEKAKRRRGFRTPDLVAVTRGPGMRNNLQCGIDTAKGLAVAWGVPLIGVHHMQAHALAPRLLKATRAPASGSKTSQPSEPNFPFLSLLVSGGHTLLVLSRSLKDHQIIASTADIAIGDCLDKVARHVLPPDTLANSSTVAYGSLLEAFAFDLDPNPSYRRIPRYEYHPPRTMGEEYEKGQVKNDYGWHFPTPLLTKDGKKSRAMEFSFGGICSHVQRIVSFGGTHNTPRVSPIELQEAKVLAQRAMQSAFEHLAGRVVLFLESLAAAEVSVPNKRASSGNMPQHLVLGGGVASNGYLKHILQKYLSARGFSKVKLCFAPQSLCVDNAAMIAWTAAEMVGAYTADQDFRLEMDDASSSLSMRAIRKWSLENLLTPEKELEREMREERERDERQKQKTPMTACTTAEQSNVENTTSQSMQPCQDTLLADLGHPVNSQALSEKSRLGLVTNNYPTTSAELSNILSSLRAEPQK
ncbi:uncharacterized protein PV09_06163 [Verruconis gallopava]|uniref:N(6)-L-threonylcarbamoyladenine synthase n=1 Tax=Verruconis gallopava TaxID=253628 RepID=A0A0D2AUA0_9PEZI|nr:uncharacterized protein PV09_06163 [Verruconis gallopava]KIW02729.1 hypothetical protein PV09_06163 [Verruconis gallopava]